jgi:hypothetical protein
MRYTDFRDSIRGELQRHQSGLTWIQLRQRLDLPYERPCPAWTKQLEKEIGLSRTKSANRALVWKIPGTRSPMIARRANAESVTTK